VIAGSGEADSLKQKAERRNAVEEMVIKNAYRKHREGLKAERPSVITGSGEADSQ
jgi:hypothetical protein